jgi:hypothetical protein
MSKELRWRVIALQIVVTIILAFAAGIGFWAHNFTHDLIGSQLTAQQITFPTANSAKVKSLPAADANAVTQYAGQTIVNGDQAHVYAEHIIRVDLDTIGHGKAYGYFSGKSIAEAKANPKLSAADEATALTLFRGDTLRSLLDQAWGIWFMGDIALYAAIGLTVAAVVVFLSFIFEAFVAPKPQKVPMLAPAL